MGTIIRIKLEEAIDALEAGNPAVDPEKFSRLAAAVNDLTSAYVRSLNIQQHDEFLKHKEAVEAAGSHPNGGLVEVN